MGTLGSKMNIRLIVLMSSCAAGSLCLQQASAAGRIPYRIVAGSGKSCIGGLEIVSNRGTPPSLPTGVELLDRPSSSASVSTVMLPEPLTGTRLLDFDFDNDGNADQVFLYENVGSYIFETRSNTPL
jgi:hypothetical protein